MPTCREMLLDEHPSRLDEIDTGMVCPMEYGYAPKPDFCGDPSIGDADNCSRCWDREIAKKKPNQPPHILDSGTRREFETGAVRDIQEGKGRCDLLPLDVVAGCYYTVFGRDDGAGDVLYEISQFTETGEIRFLYGAINQGLKGKDRDEQYSGMFLEVAKHFEEGAKKYGEYNWQKGIPVHCYIDSAVRHFFKYLRHDMDEPHDRAFFWNILCAIWTCSHKPELNEYAKEEN